MGGMSRLSRLSTISGSATSLLGCLIFFFSWIFFPLRQAVWHSAYPPSRHRLFSGPAVSEHRRRKMSLILLVVSMLAAAASVPLPSPDTVLAAANAANSYFIAHNSQGDCGWTRGTYYAGSLAHYGISKNETLVALATAWASNHSWVCAGDSLNCNSFTCGISYVRGVECSPGGSARGGRCSSAPAIRPATPTPSPSFSSPLSRRRRSTSSHPPTTSSRWP